MAAALKTKTDHVGFIGGVNVPLIQKFQAGYDAGVKATKPDVKIDNKYITEPPDFSGFNAPDKGETIAKGMYDGGADIIFAAAGGSGAGVFKAAKAAKDFGIGVDTDQYNLPSLADVKDVIITSMVKNVDVAVYDMIASVANGDGADRPEGLRPQGRRCRLRHLRRCGRRHHAAARGSEGEDHLGRDHGARRPSADPPQSGYRPRRGDLPGPDPFC